MNKEKKGPPPALIFNEIFYCPKCKENKTDITVNHGPSGRDCQKCLTRVVSIKPIEKEKVEKPKVEIEKEIVKQPRPVFGELSKKS